MQMNDIKKKKNEADYFTRNIKILFQQKTYF